MIELRGIRKFEYRPCRVATGFEVDFAVGNETLRGLCHDVSDTGIRVKLDGAVEVGESGLLTLRHSTGLLRLSAQVAYIDNLHVGLVFTFETPRDRTTATEYMAAITNHTADSMIVRFP
jgi:hypothetical protein